MVPPFTNTIFMMSLSKRKKIIAALIIGAGLLGAYFIIFSKDGNGGVFFDINFKKNQDGALNFKKENVAALATDGTFDPNNLTDVFLNKYAAEILKKNPEGPIETSGERKVTIPSQESLEKIIQEEIEGGVAIKGITANEIKNGSDNSSAAILAYIQGIISANERMSKKTNNSLGEVAYLWLEKNNSDPITKQIDALSVLVSDLLSISVPPSWKEVHISLINLQQKKIVVLRSMLDIHSDPIKAMAAANIIDKLSAEEKEVAQMIRTKAAAVL